MPTLECLLWEHGILQDTASVVDAMPCHVTMISQGQRCAPSLQGKPKDIAQSPQWRVSWPQQKTPRAVMERRQ